MMSVFVGNPDLDPEESENWDVGFDIKHRGFDFSGTYFDSSYTNMITDHVVDGSEFGLKTVRKYFNEDKAYIRGLEFGTGFDLGKYLNWSFGLRPYVYWTRLLEYEDGDGLKLENRAKDSLSFGLEFSHKDSGLTSSFDVTYYGKQIINKNTDETINSATIVDFNLIKRIYDFDKYGNMYVKAIIKNLFDRYYETVEDSPMPGRSFYVGLSYQF
jgi:vitamin B12 transporter